MWKSPVSKSVVLVASFVCVNALSSDGGQVVAKGGDRSKLIVAVPACESAYQLAWNSTATILFFAGHREHDTDSPYAYDMVRKALKILPWKWQSLSTTKWLADSGRQAAYMTQDQRKVVHVDLHSNKQTTLFEAATGRAVRQSAISPDGRWCAVITMRGRFDEKTWDQRLLVISTQVGPAPQQIWGGPGKGACEIHWAPNSEYLAWQGWQVGSEWDAEYYGSIAPRKPIAALPPDEVHCFGDWAPDSQRFAYYRLEGGKRIRIELREWDTRTGRAKVLMQLPEGAHIGAGMAAETVQERVGPPAAWSPKGCWIACAVGYRGEERSLKRSELWIVSPDGERHILLAAHSFSQPPERAYYSGWWGYPKWSPDGKAITFVRANTIRVLRLPLELTNGPTGVGQTEKKREKKSGQATFLEHQESLGCLARGEACGKRCLRVSR